MSEFPDDINESVWRSFGNSSLDLNRSKDGKSIEINAFMEFAMEAILIERKRCAGIADSRGSPGHYANVRAAIRKAILSGEQP